MKKAYLAGPLAVLLTAGAGPATDAARDAYNRFFNGNKKATQRVVDHPKNMDNLIRTAAAQELSLDLRISEMEREVQLNPTAENYVKLGRLYNDIGEYDKLGQVAKKATEIDPHNSRARNILGFFYMKNKMYSEAKNELEEAIRIDPLNSEPYTNLGAVLYELKKFNEARDVLIKGLSLNPNSEYAHLNLGGTLYFLKDYKGALKHFEVALKLNPNLKKAREWIDFLKKKLI